MGLGEVAPADGSGRRFELQLKGCGRSPYSRGFDGRAVLRSSVREFLVSEAMHHLGVPTTRALSVVGTGQEVRRPWYGVTSGGLMNGMPGYAEQNYRAGQAFSPDVMLREPGAVLCRVAPSFLRFGQLELFAKRGEMEELVMLANHCCRREFPQVLADYPGDLTDTEDPLYERTPGPPGRYLAMFREVVRRNAQLVTEWVRVGYTQGNMNSDNTLLAGRTIDYGPYGWLERFDPAYQPFTSDGDKKFSFLQQPNAMGVNVAVLGSCLQPLIKHVCAVHGVSRDEEKEHLQQLQQIAEVEFVDAFWEAYNTVRRRKIGLLHFQKELWDALEALMYRSRCDYTVFYRRLADAAEAGSAAEAFLCIEEAFHDPTEAELKVKDNKRKGARESDVAHEHEVDVDAWHNWFEKYLQIVSTENASSADRAAERRRDMLATNPKYVLRNWMAVLAYERAAEGDYSVIEELRDLLEHPYAEGDERMADKWFRKTPTWAVNMPGASFMS
jgi:uncharacterized protein YdiU (UPF0061 family)